MTEIDGIEYCRVHGGIMTEGTDYHPEGLGCEYGYIESDDPCEGTSIYFDEQVAP